METTDTVTEATTDNVESANVESADGAADTRAADGAPAVPAESPVTKVRIDTPGVTVDIEAHEPLDVVAGTAIRLFNEAGGWPQDHGRSSGFAHIERRETPPAQASSMEWAPGSYPVQMP